jgi:hypothetical protein
MMYMEINSNINAGGVQGPTSPQRPASPAKPAGDGVSLDTLAALESALKSLPDSRPEAVERAKEKAIDPNYPPPVLVHKLARLFAIQLQSESSESSDGSNGSDK